MNVKISFQERPNLGLGMLSKKSPVALEQARAQVKKSSLARKSKVKKQRS